MKVGMEGPAFADVFVLPHMVPQEDHLQLFAPEAYGQTAAGWVVQAFDAGEGAWAGTLPGAREGLEVTAQTVAAAD